MNFPLDDLMLFGVPMMPLIFGVVEFIKAQGVNGKPLTVLSMVLGVAFGVIYQVSTNGVPVGFGWAAVITFGLVVGLATSGAYKMMAKFNKARK